MFRSGMREAGEESAASATASGNDQPVEIVVPDSHVGMLRVLIYIYSGTIANADPQVGLALSPHRDSATLARTTTGIVLLRRPH